MVDIEHPDITQTMRTGYPSNDYIEFERAEVEDHPVEDMFGTEIVSGDSYFEDPEGRIVNSTNLEDYLLEIVGVKYKEAK